jgi:hypothetical protein
LDLPGAVGKVEKLNQFSLGPTSESRYAAAESEQLLSGARPARPALHSRLCVSELVWIDVHRRHAMPGSGKNSRRIPGSGYGEDAALRLEGAQLDAVVLIRLPKK